MWPRGGRRDHVVQRPRQLQPAADRPALQGGIDVREQSHASSSNMTSDSGAQESSSSSSALKGLSSYGRPLDLPADAADLCHRQWNSSESSGATAREDRERQQLRTIAGSDSGVDEELDEGGNISNLAARSRTQRRREQRRAAVIKKMRGLAAEEQGQSPEDPQRELRPEAEGAGRPGEAEPHGLRAAAAVEGLEGVPGSPSELARLPQHAAALRAGAPLASSKLSL
ncbi:unnamed protein product [Prorocentrum cordatum]|uniref:Ribosome biogenesis protein NOP53 n=1 Tax=Prorocentrum cordatum TaxID=2364126 RepID=A0ABN9Y462_9DINO|nr:unnamed protein product [Polarella glacialis]